MFQIILEQLRSQELNPHFHSQQPNHIGLTWTDENRNSIPCFWHIPEYKTLNIHLELGLEDFTGRYIRASIMRTFPNFCGVLHISAASVLVRLKENLP
jgi:hypothetical protein